MIATTDAELSALIDSILAEQEAEKVARSDRLRKQQDLSLQSLKAVRKRTRQQEQGG